MNSLLFVYSILQELKLDHTTQKAEEVCVVNLKKHAYSCIIVKKDSLQIRVPQSSGYVSLPILRKKSDELFYNYVEVFKLCLESSEIFKEDEESCLLFEAILKDLGLNSIKTNTAFTEKTAVIGFNNSTICIISKGDMVWISPPTQNLPNNPFINILKNLLKELECVSYYNLKNILK